MVKFVVKNQQPVEEPVEEVVWSLESMPSGGIKLVVNGQTAFTLSPGGYGMSRNTIRGNLPGVFLTKEGNYVGTHTEYCQEKGY